MHSFVCVCVCVCVVLCIWLISSLALWLPQSKYSYNHKTLMSPLHNCIHFLQLPIKCWYPLADLHLYKYLFYIHGILPYVSFWEWLFYTSVQSLSHVRLFETPWAEARQASLSITNSRNLLKLISIESVMPSNHLILCHPLTSHL